MVSWGQTIFPMAVNDGREKNTGLRTGRGEGMKGRWKALCAAGVVCGFLAVSVALKRPTSLISIEEADYAGGVIRTYKRSGGTDVVEPDIEETLQTLGMEEWTIDGLAEEELERLGEANWMISSTAYVRIDAQGDRTCLSEEEALAEVEALETGGSILEDAYLRMWHGMADLDGDSYQLTMAVRWLRMPAVRGRDAVGVCGQRMTVTPKTATGYYSYTRKEAAAGQTVVEEIVEIPFAQMEIVAEDIFTGVGAEFLMPADGAADGVSVVNGDFCVYLSYRGRLNMPDTTTAVNSIGTYTHSSVGGTRAVSTLIEAEVEPPGTEAGTE